MKNKKQAEKCYIESNKEIYDSILIINSGSSTIKFAIFNNELKKEHIGLVDNILTDPMVFIKSSDGEKIKNKIKVTGEKNTYYEQVIEYILYWIKKKKINIVAAGHRVVHGGPDYDTPVVIDEHIMQKLSSYSSIMPLHQPFNLQGINILKKKLPDLLQVACFDTAFHSTCNPISQHYALPKYITDTGVRRYGFHGLSYEYVASQLPNLMQKKIAEGKWVVAHLGSGATMCALENQKSVATSIGFTALGGLAMGTRCDSIDPGCVIYLMDTYNLNKDKLLDLVYKKSGLLGVSGISSDMRVLLESEEADAKLAIDIFVHRVSIMTGQLACEMQGIDGFVFTAGIGENAAPIREMICDKLKWLGIEIDQEKNLSSSKEARIISAEKSKVPVWVIPTDEELMIAKQAAQFLKTSFSA